MPISKMYTVEVTQSIGVGFQVDEASALDVAKEKLGIQNADHITSVTIKVRS